MRNGTTVLALIVLVLSMGFSFAFTPEASPTEVKPGQSIQQAINEANTGDTILVGSGIYYENIIVNKTVVLEGEGWTTTIVDGMGAENHVLLINADNVVIRGLMIRNTSIDIPGVAGIHIFGANNVTIANCKTTLCYHGIRLTDTSQSDVVENLIGHNYAYGISLHGNSSSNRIVGNNIENNPTGIYIASLDCKDNIVFHNNFENTNRNAQTLGQETVWDDDYPSGGNYWSDYVGSDVNKGPEQDLPGSDGFGDTPYFVNEAERDRYPFMTPYTSSPTYTLAITATAGGTTDPDVGTHNYTVNSEVQVMAVPNMGFSFDYWVHDGEVRTENPITTVMDSNHALQAFFVDDIWPDINTPIQEPAENVEPYQNVTITVNVTDFGTGVHNVTLWYGYDNGTTWVPLNMLGISANTYQETIPGYGNCTWVTYRIVAYDNEGNQALNDNNGYLYGYHVVPEFSSVVLLPFFVVTFTIAVVLARRKSPKKHS